MNSMIFNGFICFEIRILMCVDRSLGVHLSKVRSLTLDSWEPEQLKVRHSFHQNLGYKLVTALIYHKIASHHWCTADALHVRIKTK